MFVSLCFYQSLRSVCVFDCWPSYLIWTVGPDPWVGTCCWKGLRPPNSLSTNPEKSIEKLENLRKIRIWGLENHLTVNVIERLTQKLRIITLLHLGPITFEIHFRRRRKPIIFMIFGLGGRVHDSHNQYYLSLETPGHSN